MPRPETPESQAHNTPHLPNGRDLFLLNTVTTLKGIRERLTPGRILGGVAALGTVGYTAHEIVDSASAHVETIDDIKSRVGVDLLIPNLGLDFQIGTPQPASSPGGRGFTERVIPGGGDMLTWQAGPEANAFLWKIGTETGQTLLPRGSNLPIRSSQYMVGQTEVSADRFSCFMYVVPGIANSDLLCASSGIASVTNAPTLGISLNESRIASLNLGAAAAGVDTRYLVPLGGNPIQLAGNATAASYDTQGNTTCFIDIDMRGTTAVGNSEVACGFPGHANFPDTSATATPTRLATPSALTTSTATETRVIPTVTPSPDFTPTRTPDRTPTLIIPGVSYDFGADVPDADRNFIRNTVSWTQDYWGGRAIPVKVYAFSNIDSLLDAFNRDCVCSDWTGLWDLLRSQISTEGLSAAPGGRGPTGRGALLIPVYQTGVLGNLSELTRLQYITHTQEHSYQYGLTGGPVDPVWMAEGNADYFSAKVLASQGRSDFSVLRRSIISEAKSMPYSLNQLESWSTQIPRRAPYAHGFLATDFLVSRYGEASILEDWRNYGQSGGSWQNAFQNTFGVSVADFYRQYDSYLSQL